MPTRFWEVPNVIAIGSAGIALLAMFVSLVQTVFARKAATEARRQADAALGEVPPLIFLDEATDRDTTSGGDANLTIINLNRRDLRILQIDYRS